MVLVGWYLAALFWLSHIPRRWGSTDHKHKGFGTLRPHFEGALDVEVHWE